MAEWAAFGRRYLQDGDILFCRGAGTSSRRAVASTRFFADVTDSPFSHEGIAHWLDGTVWVYDVKAEGVRDMPFEFWILDVAEHSLAVRRVRPIYRDRTPQRSLLPGVLRPAGALRHDFLPGRRRTLLRGNGREGLLRRRAPPVRSSSHPPATELRQLPAPRAACRIMYRYRPDTPVFAPGNEYYGTYSSPYLEEVFQCEEISEALRMCKAPVAESE